MDEQVIQEQATEASNPEESSLRISLNTAIREYLENQKDDFRKDCPLCQGKNLNCNYYKPFTATKPEHGLTNMNSSPSGKGYSLDVLKQVKEALGEKTIVVMADGIEYDYRPGPNLDLTSRGLDLLAFYSELPFLRDIGNRLRINQSLNMEENGTNTTYQLSFPAFRLCSGQFNFNRLTSDSREAIINSLQEVLTDLSQETESYKGLELIPVQDLADRQSTAAGGAKPSYFAEIIQMNHFLQLENEIYGYLSNLEEWIMSRSNNIKTKADLYEEWLNNTEARVYLNVEKFISKVNNTEAKTYLCSDLDQLRSRLSNYFAMIMTEIQSKI